jgi:hypothetical protein
MNGKSWRVFVPVALVALGVLCSAPAREKATDEGKAEDFKGKAFDLKEKGKASITLIFAAGKEATITVRSDKKSDVNLFIYNADKKVVAKDDSEGPSCDITWTPKEAGKYTLQVVNLGPGANRSTLKVSFGKKDKPKDKE